MMKHIAPIILLLILTSCVNNDKDYFSKRPDTEFVLDTKKNSSDIVLIVIDQELVGSKSTDEIINASQLAFMWYAENKFKNQKPYKIAIEKLSPTDIKNIYHLYEKYKNKNITNVISFLNMNELRKVSFFFKTASVYSMQNFKDLSFRNIKYLNNNMNDILSIVTNIVKSSSKILFIDYNEKLKFKFDKTLVDMNFTNDMMIDYVPFNSLNKQTFESFITTNKIDTLILNTNIFDTKELLENTNFSGTLVLLNPLDVEIANLPKIEKMYFTFLDFELFKDFSNTYTRFFNQDPPSLYSYITYKLVLSILLDNEIDLSGMQKFVIYKKFGNKIIKY